MEWLGRVKQSFSSKAKQSGAGGTSILETLDKKYEEIITRYEF